MKILNCRNNFRSWHIKKNSVTDPGRDERLKNVFQTDERMKARSERILNAFSCVRPFGTRS
jgi:hypothetical protein